MKIKTLIMMCVGAMVAGMACGADALRPQDGGLWPDDKGVHVNAHGGGVLFAEGRYWWFGEHKVAGTLGNTAQVGVHAYSSTDLANWKDEGIALAVIDDPKSDIFKGCILERPKVVRMPATGKYVMYFHLEKDKGYTSALAGVAVSDTPKGPYRYVKCLRPNAGQLPLGTKPGDVSEAEIAKSAALGNLPGSPNDIARANEIWPGHLKGGQMCRDMTLFVDDDKKVYHIFASEHNSTLHIAELTPDGLGYVGPWTRLAVKDWTEAPAVFKKDGWYYLVGSGCTGWAPNAARYYRAKSILGPWERMGNPCVGVNPANGIGPEKTWGGQSTCVFKVEGKDEFVAMFDVWNPADAIDGRYIWRTVEFPRPGEIRIPFGVAKPATVREISVDYLTYGYGDPNPTPNPDWNVYPYFRYDGYDANGKTQAWNVVRLENDYVYVDVFPDIGGKVWNAHDKVNGKDFVYNNPVVKFRDIAHRGAWTSGGIEFNFGIIGHQATVGAPVDYVTRTNDDGSSSCFISSFDWIDGTFWSVEVRLPANAADFETRVSWFNASPLEQPYYQWMNAAYKTGVRAEYVFPGNAFIGHGTELNDWPIDRKGHDLRFYDNYKSFSNAESEHVIGHYGDFYGVYYHGEDFGTVHNADYDAKLGQKIFLWSPAREGEIWADLLTDGGGQYVELQSGRLFNQPAWSKLTCYKNGSFSPMATERWTERWFPVAKIDGFSKASEIGALRVTRKGDALELAFSSLMDATRGVRVYDGDKEVAAFDATFKTLTPWTKTLAGLGAIPQGALRVLIDDDKLVYTERKADFELSRPKKSTYDYDGTAYGNFVMGVQAYLEKSWDESERRFKKALEMDPDYIPAHTKFASLLVREGRCAEAMPHLDRAIAFNAYDGEANYLRALASRALGNLTDAKDGFSLATRDGALRSAANVGLAELFAAEGRWEKAKQYALRAVANSPENLMAQQILAVVCRMTGEWAEGRVAIEKTLAVSPLWHFGRAEQAWLEGKSLKDAGFGALLRCEKPGEICREIALWYIRLGLTDEAEEVLSFAANDPLAVYTRAWAASRSGKKDAASVAKALVERANKMPSDFVFPYRPEEVGILEWASSVADAPILHYYRGLVLWRNRRFADALTQLDAANGVETAAFYLARAHLKQRLGKDRKDDLLAALKAGGGRRAYAALIDEAESRCDWKEAVAWGDLMVKNNPDDFLAILKFAGSLCSDGQYERCLKLLENVNVMPAEGAWLGHYLYRLANIQRAVELLRADKLAEAKKFLAAAYLWPERLGAGKPQDFSLDLRVEHYVEAMIAQKDGDEEARRKWLDQISTFWFTGKFNTGNFVSALAMRDLGKKEWADAMIATWEKDATLSESQKKTLKCCAALYRGDAAAASKLALPPPRDDNAAVWTEPVRDVNIHILLNLLK